LIASWSPDETSILTIGSDWHSIQVWDISTSLNTGATAGDLRFIQEVDSKLNIKLYSWFPWSPDGDRFVTAHDDSARIWDAAAGTVQFILSGHEDTVTDAAWSPKGDYIVTTSLDNRAILWNAVSGKALKSYPGTEWGIKFGHWSSNGDRFTLRGFGRVTVYETTTGAELLRRSLPGLWIQDTRFSPDGSQLIATIYQDGTARLLDTETGELYSMLSGLTQGLGISCSPSGEYASVVGADGRIRIWDTITGLELQQFPFFGANLALWSPAEDRVYAAGKDSNEVRVFKLSAALASIPGLRGFVSGVNWSPDGQQFCRAYADGIVKVWEAESMAESLVLESGTLPLTGAIWSPNGDRILTHNEDSSTRIWDASNGEQLLEFGGHESMVFSGQWSPDNSRIVTAEPYGNTFILWEAESGEEIWKISIPGAGVAIWSPDGTRIATTTLSGHGSIREAATGEVMLGLFDSYPVPIEGTAWSSDGTRIVIFSKGEGWIFDTTSGEQIVELSSGFTSSVWDVHWSPGDAMIFAIGGDGTYRAFEAATGIELLVYELGGWPAGSLSPDGTLMLIGTNDGKISLYPVWLTTEELIAYAKECCLLRELTPEEREVFGLPEKR
jgi:WD40 repeat protein